MARLSDQPTTRLRTFISQVSRLRLGKSQFRGRRLRLASVWILGLRVTVFQPESADTEVPIKICGAEIFTRRTYKICREVVLWITPWAQWMRLLPNIRLNMIWYRRGCETKTSDEKKIFLYKYSIVDLFPRKRDGNAILNTIHNRFICS